MAFASGTKLGSYEILSPLGKGGMGEVWRARDQKLGREVAIKTLPEEFAKDEERLARFEREAKLLASLNHPNIAAIYGLEEDNGTRFLVLELVEGDTLAERLKRGAIPVEESLQLALQIAEALEAAHEKGVIHRDLKPANIKVTPDGKIKVLDFGLAKAFAGDGTDVNLSQSPTLSLAATQQGVILGTAAYMSPEQARGVAVDSRADVWAFGCVFYEMLTGRQAFQGELVSDIMASVLARDPDYTTLQTNLHPSVQQLLRRCLEKEPKQRWQAVGDVRFEMEQLLSDPNGLIVQPVADLIQAQPRPILPWALTTIVLLVVASVAVWYLKPVEPRLVSRFSYVLPEEQSFTRPGRHVLDISPDGTRIVYVANGQLYLRDLDELGATPIAGTEEGPNSPTFSPDGQSIAYQTLAGELKKVAISGGAAIPIADIDNPFGMTWQEDDTIIFGHPNGIMKVPATGGTPELLIETEEGEQVHGPALLPGGEWVLFTLATTRGPDRWDEAEIVVQSLETNQRKILIQGGSDARYVPTGHIVYALESDLFAVPFDAAALERTGGPVSIVEGVRRVPNPGQLTGTANYSFSDQGALVYVVGTGSAATRESDLALVDRDGVAERLNVPPADYRSPRVSPDGTHAVVWSLDSDAGDADGLRATIWVYDLSGNTSIRPLTFDGINAWAIWTPDGEWITFTSTRDAEQPDTDTMGSIYRTRADGSGVAERLTTAEVGHFHAPESYSSDGRLSFRSQGGVWTLSGEDGAEPEIFVDLPESNQAGSVFSPDGNWIAYHSNESGESEIYVQPFPPTGQKSQITQSGGVWSVWSRDGSQLFFQRFAVFGGGVIAVDIETTPAVTFGNPQPIPLATIGNRRNFDIMPDGERFVVRVPVADEETEDEEAPAGQINIILNWFEELKEKVPVP